jgi:hypothetical protein
MDIILDDNSETGERGGLFYLERDPGWEGEARELVV